MAKRLHERAVEIGLWVGCGDSSCIWGAPRGMATNGGCRCIDHQTEPRELRRQARMLAELARYLLRQAES
jgi:hypothetical protein